jgi:hypothetical protein
MNSRHSDDVLYISDVVGANLDLQSQLCIVYSLGFSQIYFGIVSRRYESRDSIESLDPPARSVTTTVIGDTIEGTLFTPQTQNPHICCI